MIYYSLSTKGFYDTDFGYKSIPKDSIKITKDEYKQLYAGVNSGKTIQVKNSKLILVDSKPPLTWNLIRLKRNRLLADSDYTQMPDWPGDKKAWSEYRQQLRDLPSKFDDPNDVIWPSAPA